MFLKKLSEKRSTFHPHNSNRWYDSYSFASKCKRFSVYPEEGWSFISLTFEVHRAKVEVYDGRVDE